MFALPEINRTTDRDERVAGRPVVRLYHVSNPTLTLYPPSGHNSGTAVLVLPGGGFYMVAIDIEGTEICEWLRAQGITCALLKYRVPHAGPYPLYNSGLQDAQRAMGLLRAHAVEWGIRPDHIGVLGFSAGGQIAAGLGAHFAERLYAPVDDADRLSCRPDFAVLAYPGYLRNPFDLGQPNPDVLPIASTPPTLLIQAEDDPIQVENATTYFLALSRAHVAAEMHLYADGGHGYGIRQTGASVNRWPQAMLAWLHTIHRLD